MTTDKQKCGPRRRHLELFATSRHHDDHADIILPNHSPKVVHRVHCRTCTHQSHTMQGILSTWRRISVLLATGVPRGRLGGATPPIEFSYFWIVCLHKITVQALLLYTSILNFVLEKVKNCSLISTVCFSFWGDGLLFSKFSLQHLWTSIVKSWVRLWKLTI